MWLTNKATAKKQFKRELTTKAGGRLHPIKVGKKWVLKEVASRKTMAKLHSFR